MLEKYTIHVNRREKLYRYLLILIFSISSGYAEIYTGHDQQGKTYFSDRPLSGSVLLDLKPVGYSWYTVKKVVDGDTVTLDSGLKIRLASINTPEIESRHRLAEAGGDEAKKYLTKWLQGKQIRLVKDLDKKDKYGRTLAHLFTHDQQHINLELVARGLAIVNLYPPNLKYHQALLHAQKQAEAAFLGLWQYPQYQPKPMSMLGLKKLRGWQRLLGTVQYIRTKKKYSYLIFNDQIDLRIAKKNLTLFPPLQEYVGKPLEIRGWPTRRKQHYSILIRHPSAIKILADLQSP